jgi:hypothetical protein
MVGSARRNTVKIDFYASYGIVLRLLDLGGDRDLDDLLIPIGNSVRSSIKIVEEADKRGEQEDDWIIDDECERVEMSLGLTFVAAQTYMTRVISYAKRLHDWHERQTKSRLLLGITGQKKDEILGVVTPKICGTQYTAAEAVNSFANYFKHRDEWPFNWSQLTRSNEKQTVAVIEALGAQPGSTGNLRCGYSSLFGQNVPFDQVTRLTDVVLDWARALKSAYEQELQSGGFWSRKAS